MAEYTKLEDAVKKLAEILYDEPPYIDSDIAIKRWAEEQMADVPSADVAEVRHGHWEILRPKSLRLDIRDSLFVCSECGADRIRRTGEILNYCPNCGAKMDGKEQEHD